MAQQLLVESDITTGEDFIRMLVEHGLDVQFAAWIFYTDLDEWKLTIGSNRARLDSFKIYLDVSTWLHNNQDLKRRFDLARMKIVRPDDPFLKALAKMVYFNDRPTVRLTHNAVDGFYIDDALVYRLAA